MKLLAIYAIALAAPIFAAPVAIDSVIVEDDPDSSAQDYGSQVIENDSPSGKRDSTSGKRDELCVSSVCVEVERASNSVEKRDSTSGKRNKICVDGVCVNIRSNLDYLEEVLSVLISPENAVNER